MLNRVDMFFCILSGLLLATMVSCSGNDHAVTRQDEKIKVGVFDGYGGSETCKWEAFEAVSIDSAMDVRYVTSADIAGGCLDSLDAIVIPGGGGSRQYMNLGDENRSRIIDFVKTGGGAVGICAGAYLFSNTPNYACMKLNGAAAIDIEHDNRGHGLAKFTLNDEGNTLFPELAGRDTSYVMYYEGPVFVKADDTITYDVFATMWSDVHEEGNAPKNMTNNKPLFIGNDYGEGRVFSSIAHPEATPGMRWLVPRMIRWTLKKDYVSYSDDVVRPHIHTREILFSKAMLKEEASLYDVLLYGSEKEKIDAIDWLQANMSWDAKRWIQGMLYDASPLVRQRAAKYIADMELTYYTRDVEESVCSSPSF